MCKIVGGVRSQVEADNHGKIVAIKAVIDTGYTGFLTLPSAIITALDLTCYTRQEGILGDDMTQLFDKHQPSRGRIFTEHTILPEELARRQAERVEIGERCRVIFERVRPELIDKYSNWFIAIEPNSGEYLIDPKLECLLQKVRDRYASTDVRLTTFRLNETGAYGQI